MGSERRTSYRIAIPEAQSNAVLRVGRREVVVRMVNASAGGYELASGEPLVASPGQLFPLRMASGWCEVKIVWSEPADQGTALGVEFVRELDSPLRGAGRNKALTLIGGGVLTLVVGGWLLWNYSPEQDQDVPQPSELFSKIAEQAQKVSATVRGKPPPPAAPPPADAPAVP